MEYRIEKGDPLLRLWCSIIPNLNTGVYYNSATTQTINHTSDGRGDKKYTVRRKGKRCKIKRRLNDRKLKQENLLCDA